MPRLALGAVALALLLAAGCSTQHYTLNRPLEARALPAVTSDAAAAPGGRYRMRNLHPDAGDEVLLFVSFSGGGMRAAALGYAVAEVLDDLHYVRGGRRTSLLQEVDIVTSVSGGSLFAAWLALHGAQGLKGFESVLHSDLSSRMLWRWLSPRGLWVSASSHYGRGDLLQEVLDEDVFHGRTVGDLARNGRRPLVAIRATDLSQGTAFDFTQETFDRICSDVSTVPLARAVAASMAVPVLFSPITLQGFGRNCAARLAPEQLDRRGFVHLLDGGLVDNLGVRGPVDYIDGAGGFAEASRRNGLAGARRVAFIVVNSETAAPSPEDEDGRTPSPMRTLNAWIDVPIARSTLQNLDLLRGRIQTWQREMSAQPGGGPAFFYAEVNFRRAESEALQRQLNGIPTSLANSLEDARALRRHARQRLLAEPGFLALLASLGIQPEP